MNITVCIFVTHLSSVFLSKFRQLTVWNKEQLTPAHPKYTVVSQKKQTKSLGHWGIIQHCTLLSKQGQTRKKTSAEKWGTPDHQCYPPLSIFT